MRISVLRNDMGYQDPALCSQVKLTLDGELVQGAITADEEKGVIFKYVLDEDGHIVLRDQNSGPPLIETVYGKVKIEVPEDLKQFLLPHQ